MAWIESHQDLLHHPKTQKLARILCISRVTAIGHLHCLWWWAVDYAEDGNLSQFDALDIAIGGEWEGDPQEFTDALIFVGFIDVDGKVRTIHNWDKYFGRLLEQRQANARRQREWRERHKDETPTSETRNGDITVTERSRTGATVPNPTVPNPTKPAAPLPPKPTEKPPQQINATYEHTLNGHFSKVADRFARIDQQYTAGWLRSTLLYCEAQIGPLPLPQLGKGIELTIDQLQRAKADDKIRSPRAFARKVMVDYLTEQRDEHHAA
jgi:hypothetical protein